ncbi:hypothetical protein Mal52_17210 [Symmachiella dynata]|uniref:Uncharacterized protein n=1 Tax=Symmachiella dynata TaxID=2527995 RepID=A0A517ZL79_9PLAN|nr:hypothetical protein [Symmachiella dynata]QDU43249.1 hypothetical protein Mal52_17210 [Symmachiella dynata]
MRFVGRILLLIGLGATIFGGFNSYLSLRGTSEPEPVTLSALGAADGTNNTHLSISEFTVGEQFVIEASENGKWRRVWIPLMTPENAWPARPVIAYTDAAANEMELATILQRQALTGVVTNGMQGLGKNQREQFAIPYPGVNLDGALAFSVDHSFPSAVLMIPLTLIGLVFLVAGGGMYFGFFGGGGDE